VKNGVLESEAPSVPANFKAALENGDVQLSWDASTDNIGVCGYIVYRNGVQISKTLRTTLYGSPLIPLPTSLSDGGLAPNTEYIYTVKAYDFANNISVAAPEVKVTTEAGNKYPVNIAREVRIQFPFRRMKIIRIKTVRN
jgi:beta-fructofuranosidase